MPGPMNKVGLGEIGDMEPSSRRALKWCFKLQQPEVLAVDANGILLGKSPGAPGPQ